MPQWTPREARADDLEMLAEMRRLMFEAIAPETPLEDLEAVAEGFLEFACERIRKGEYRGWIAEADGRPIGTIGVIVESRPPTLKNTDGRIGYLLNVYVEPAFRRRGVGRALVRAALDALHAEGVGAAALHASVEGRALYETLGFRASSEMRLFRP